jgi:hypothetical protein
MSKRLLGFFERNRCDFGVVYVEKKVYLCRLFENVFTEKKVIDYES